MKKFRALVKSERFVFYSSIIIVFGILLFFYFQVYKPFSVKKSLMYIRSDFLIVNEQFENINEYIKNSTDNNSTDYYKLLADLQSLENNAYSNLKYIYKAGLSDAELGSRLLFYYSDIQYLAEDVRPRIEFEYYTSQLDDINSALMLDITHTDNYYYIADFIDASIIRINSLKTEFDQTAETSNFDIELRNLIDQYFEETIQYYLSLQPVVIRIPDYLQKNDRDQTRLIMKEILDLSKQFVANEQNIEQMADEYFSLSQNSLLATLQRITNESAEISIQFNLL